VLTLNPRGTFFFCTPWRKAYGTGSAFSRSLHILC
jgi:hypothetical protein